MTHKRVDGYVNSFPKSGRTWVRYMLAQYFRIMYQIEKPIGFTTLGMVFSDTGEKQRAKEYEDFPNIVFSHLHPQKEQAHAVNIMIVRNALDVLVSYYYHHDARSKMETGVYKGLMEYGFFISEYVDYMNQWFGDQRNKFTIIHYEKLHDPIVWFDMIESFGHIGDKDNIAEAMMLSNFENMQRDEIANPQVLNNWSSDPNHLRVRKGKIGGWKDELSVHQAQNVLNKIREKLNVTAEHALKIHGVLPESV